jgi:hypothetical protein
MGFFDDFASMVSGGAASVERNMNAARLKSQLVELAESRRDLLAQLGEALLRTVKNDPLLRETHEELLTVIEKVEAQQAAVEAELAAIEQRAAQERAANTVYECPKCYRRVLGSQQFCSGCGTPISVIIEAMEEADAAVSGKELPTCINCGARITQDDAFCSKCGTKQ